MIDVTEEKCINTIVENAENIMPDDSNNELQYNQTYNVKVPKASPQILLDMSSVRKIKRECESAKNQTFPYAELFLGVSSLFLGAFLGALFSQVPYELSFLSILYYSICPVVGVAFGVAYFLCRKKSISDIKHFAIKIEEFFENIDIIEESGEENEY